LFDTLHRSRSDCLPSGGLSSENRIAPYIDNDDASRTLTETGSRSVLPVQAQFYPPPELSSVGKPAGTDTMKTIFDILKKDRKGTFHWVEAVNDIDTAQARLRQLSAESTDEFVVFRNIDLKVVATSSQE
jgi:hypothetical protein